MDMANLSKIIGIVNPSIVTNMANPSRIMWTALPKGIDTKNGGRTLLLSAFVSLRLQSEGEDVLGSFPQFKDWPKRLQGMEFSVNFGSFKAAARVKDPKFSSDLWTKLFKESTFLKPYHFNDHAAKIIRSYPVQTIHSAIKDNYVHIAANSPINHPPTEALLHPQALGGLVYSKEEEPIMKKQFSIHLASNKAISTKDLGTLAGANTTKAAFLQLKAFHEPVTAKPIPLPRYPADSSQFEHMLDFHQMLSALANFPEMMRLLGLLIDLEVESSGVPFSYPSQPLFIQLQSPGFDPATDYAPMTAYLFDAEGFSACPNPTGPEFQGGMLPLQDANAYELVQIDTDGAALKAMNLANSLGKGQGPNITVGAAVAPQSHGLPFLRSAGFSVAQVDKGAKLSAHFLRARVHNDLLTKNTPTLLYAEDVTRGYRIDVWDSFTKQWHSLNLRSGTYNYVGDSNAKQLIVDNLVDEGWVQTGVTQSADPSVPDQNKELNVHESLFSWRGWSLSVTRPGQTIDPSDLANSVDPITATQLKLKATFKPVKDSLPALRLGRSYRLRARVVDLGGHSLTIDEADPSKSTPETPYLRFEPVLPPVLVLKSPLDPDVTSGETLEKLVIRSYNDDVSKDKVATNEKSERHVAPPKTSQLDAEYHGMFDDPSGRIKRDAKTYSMIASKDKGSFTATKRGDPIAMADTLELPYLPDPMAKGASMVGLPHKPTLLIKQLQPEVLPGGSPQAKETTPTPAAHYEFAIPPSSEEAPVTQVDYGKPSEWPEFHPFRIRLAEGSADPGWDASSRVLTVYLPKAGVAQFRISSYMPEEKIDILGLWNWIGEAQRKGIVDPILLNRLKNFVLQGRHWMLTPFREILLIHAVQQPLGTPEFTALEPVKYLGGTFANLSGVVTLDGKSTVKMDMMACWDERRDNPRDSSNDPVKDRVHCTAQAFEIPINPQDQAANFWGDYARRHNFGDTKYRHVVYQAVTTSRFMEYMPKSIRADTPPKVTRASKEQELDIPSSARPAVPGLLYIIPIFGWSQGAQTSAGGTSTRKGKALRVYLTRPWFSSGDGEKLGVVLLPGKLPSDDELERLKHCITMFGMDPIWGSAPTPSNLAIGNFKNNLPSSRSGLTLEEMPGTEFDVAAHDVNFDYDRKLWYSDIVIDAGDSYFPFVRLALARFQPVSVDGTHLSHVVLADFAQLAPDRTMSLIRVAPGVVRVTVSGTSYASRAERSGDVVGGRSEVEVAVERYDPAIGTDLGWVSEPNATVTKDVTMPSLSTLFSATVTIQQIAEKPQQPQQQILQRKRLVVREYEILSMDRPMAELVDLAVADVGGRPTPSSTPSSAPSTARRLVYADYIEF